MFTRLFLLLVLLSGYALAVPKDYVCSKAQLEAISKGKGELAFSGRSIIMIDTIEFEKLLFSDYMRPTDVNQEIKRRKFNFPVIEYDFLYRDRLKVYTQPNANDFVTLIAKNTDWSASVGETAGNLGNHYKFKAIKPITKKTAKNYPKGTGFAIQDVDIWQDQIIYIRYSINQEDYYTCSGKKNGDFTYDTKFKDTTYNEKSPWYKEARFLQKIKSGESYPSRVY